MTPSALSEFIYGILAESQAGSGSSWAPRKEPSRGRQKDGSPAVSARFDANVVPLRPCPACRGRGVAQDHPDSFGNYDQCPGCEGTGCEGIV